MVEVDFYKTVIKPSEGIYKEKGSRFIARVFHVGTIGEIKEYISQMKKEYHGARHYCYAYRINPENEIIRGNDNGEPAGTAGKPILNQIISYELYNVLIVVIRYFGGTKLGVSRLIRAYKSAASSALDKAEIITDTLTRKINISFEYSLTNEVMRVINESKLKVINKSFGGQCYVTIEVERNQKEKIKGRFDGIPGVTIN